MPMPPRVLFRYGHAFSLRCRYAPLIFRRRHDAMLAIDAATPLIDSARYALLLPLRRDVTAAAADARFTR